ncbi:hypothetical protein K469DRAFT_687510 [Zopfia rhizophila CBS 207.26]|uniref:Uncharacterized protein n=1 Tax=Zopfia rhizophila CBS 207.26 TaxID=1314779 RepID=A0A6A6E524_9PEZI|nr:hypothetical protein K469DRAFT_687510 [Zopfia rhizophila CBS 207.26]
MTNKFQSIANLIIQSNSIQPAIGLTRSRLKPYDPYYFFNPSHNGTYKRLLNLCHTLNSRYTNPTSSYWHISLTPDHPPQLPQDYVFIVVPDSWSFLEKSSRDSLSTSPPTTTSAKRSSSDPRSKFMSPAKRKSDQLSDPVTPKASSDNRAHMTTPSWDMSDTHTSPPPKRPHTDHILQKSVHKDSSPTITLYEPSTTPSSTPTHAANLLRTKPINTSATNLVPYSTPQAPVLSTDDRNRPHRNRQPTKKVLNID